MTTNELLVLAGGVAAGAALVLLTVLAVVLRRRRGASPDEAGAGGAGDLRHLGRRIRRLDLIARRAQARVKAQVEELRRLLARAERLTGGVPARASDAAPSAEPEEAPLPAIVQSQRDQVLRLSLQGLEPIDIARRMSMPIGEVELTLRLHQKEHEPARTPGGA